MAQNLPDWFPEKWSEEITTLSQQMKPRVADTVANGGYFSADAVYFPRIGTVEALDAARLQEFSSNAPPLDWIQLKASPKFLPIKIWDPDKSKLTIPVVQEMARATHMGINRALDDMVIDALNDACENNVQPVRGRSAEAQAAPAAEAVTTIGDYNTVIDLDLIAHGIALLGEADVDVEQEQLTFLTSFKNKLNLSLDPLMVNANVRMKDLPWENLNWRSSTRLPGLPKAAGALAGNGAHVDCYLYARSAAATGWNNDVTDINERLGSIMADMIGQWFQGGAVVKEAAKIIRIKGKQDFTVTRRPLDVFDHAV